MESFVQYLLKTLLFITSLFLILLVLVQRGRGGGLAGAFGGAGGQSAFGTKAGDVFTRVTIVVAALWIVLCALSVKALNANNSVIASDIGKPAASPTAPVGAQGKNETPAGEQKPAEPGATTPAPTAGEAPAKQPPASQENVSAGPEPKGPAPESAPVGLPPGALTPNGSVAPQAPMPTDKK